MPLSIQENDSEVDLMLGWGLLFMVGFFIRCVGSSSCGVGFLFVVWGFYSWGWVFCIFSICGVGFSICRAGFLIVGWFSYMGWGRVS